MADFTPEQEKEFEFRRRYEEEQATKQQEVVDKQINPLMPAVGGAVAAEILGPSINRSSEAFMETKKLIKSGWDPKVASDFVRGKFGAVENWARQMHSGEFFGGRDMPEAYRQGMQTKYPGGIPANPVPGGPMPVGTPVPTTPTPGALPPGGAAAPKAAPTGMMGKIAGSPTVQALKAASGAGSSGIVPAVIGRGVAGGSAAYQGVDAFNRLQQGDIPGAVISGVGAFGSGAALIPHPVTRFGGTALGIGAEALNSYLDYLKKKAQQPAPEATPQPQPQPAPQGMAQGGLVGGLDATYNMPLAGGASLSIGGPQQQQQPMQQSPLTTMMPQMAGGGSVFDPAGSGYDYKTAFAHGMGPTGTGEDKGHFGSVAPTSDDEQMLHGIPRESYVMLKGKAHETFDKAEKAEKERGSKVVKSGSRYYSVPK